ncbi:CHASE3 domain-containing protein, partial [Sulfurimonas sp. SAG-AH-194-I05]
MMSLKLKLGLFITLLFSAAISNAIFTFVLEGYSDKKLHWVAHTHEVMLKTQNYLGSLKDTETGQRGYLLTKDINYLEPYHRGVINAEESFKELTLLTSDNPIQQKRLKKIETSMHLKFAELKTTIELAQSGEKGHTKALEIVKENQGKYIMDDIRRELSKFRTTESLLLEVRKGDFREQKASLTTLIAIEILFFLFLAFITYAFLNRNLFEPLDILLKGTQ